MKFWFHNNPIPLGLIEDDTKPEGMSEFNAVEDNPRDEYMDFLKKFEIEHDVKYVFEWIE